MAEKMSKEMAVAILSMAQFRPTPDLSGEGFKKSATSMGREYGNGGGSNGMKIKITLPDTETIPDSIMEVLGLTASLSDGEHTIFSNTRLDVPFNNGRPFDRDDVVISSDGGVNKAGIKFLLEAGVKNPVLEVAAKELGIEVEKSHAAQIKR